MFTDLFEFMEGLGQRLRTHPLAVFVICGVVLIYGTILALGFPGALGTNLPNFWKSFDDPVIGVLVTLFMFVASYWFTIIVIVGEVLVVSIVAGITSHQVTHVALRLPILGLLVYLAIALAKQGGNLMATALASSLSMWKGEVNYDFVATFIAILNLLLVIAAMNVPIPDYVSQDMAAFKLLGTFLRAKDKQIKALVQAETLQQVELIAMGATPNWADKLLAPGMVLNQHRFRQLEQKQLENILRANPQLAPFRRDLYIGPNGRLGIGVDQTGTTVKSQRFLGIPPGGVLDLSTGNAPAQIAAPQPGASTTPQAASQQSDNQGGPVSG